MDELICINKCFFRNRLWVPGETLEPRKGEQVPKHFKQKADLQQKEKRLVKDDPKTFHEIQIQQEKEELKRKKALEAAALKKAKKAKAKSVKEQVAELEKQKKKQKKQDAKALRAVGHGKDKANFLE